jgi:hypothetical protein
MMARWYAAFRCVGQPEVILTQIAQKVRNDDLGRFVPRVHFERGIHRHKRQEFYLCLAIDSPMPGQVPPQVEGLLALSCLAGPNRAAGRPLQHFTRDQIQPFVGAGADVQDYARRIQRSQIVALPVEDPFGPMDGAATDPEDVADLVGRTARFDRLLLWLSAAGGGSMPTFQQACRTLGLVEPGLETWQILRRLRLLGHLETSPDGARWSVAPTVLTCIAGAADTLVLCGARDEAMRTALRRAWRVEDIVQQDGGGPATVLIHGPIEMVMAAMREQGTTALPPPDCAAERLAELLPPIEGWIQALDQLHGIVPTLHDVRRFDGSDFVDVPFVGRAGLYELQLPEHQAQAPTPPRYTLYYDASRDRWLRGDWYGLRYVARCADGGACEVEWDREAGRLSVPDGWRWPELYERALVLASGRLPARHGERLVYNAITPRLVDLFTPKLRLRVQEAITRA